MRRSLVHILYKHKKPREMSVSRLKKVARVAFLLLIATYLASLVVLNRRRLSSAMDAIVPAIPQGSDNAGISGQSDSSLTEHIPSPGLPAEQASNEEEELPVRKRKRKSFDEEVDKMARLMRGMDKKRIFQNVIRSIKIPPAEKKTFAKPFPGQKLSLAIVEVTRTEFLIKVLYNMAWVYGDSDVSLFIFHGTQNEVFVKDVTRQWKNVQYVNLNYAEYPSTGPITLTDEFLHNFQSEYVLFFDTNSLIKKQIPNEFFKYDYVGGPWHEKIANLWEKDAEILIRPERRVGNGGFSLRKVSAMKEIAKIYYPRDLKSAFEDQWISKNLKEGSFPPVEVAAKFAVDSMYNEDPCGVHIFWEYSISHEEAIRLLYNVPGSDLFVFDQIKGTGALDVDGTLLAEN